MTELNLTNLSNHDTILTSTTTQEITMTLQPSSHHVNTTLSKDNSMDNNSNHLYRLTQVLHSNETLLLTIETQLGEALQLYDYIPTPQTQTKVQLLQGQYDELSEKVDAINTAYQQFLKDGTVPEWL
jgi:hypothetical protein